MSLPGLMMKKVRGHAILWANKGRNPQWVQDITDPSRMYNITMKRIDDLFAEYQNRLVHWDVNNEMLTNSFYVDVYNSDRSIRYDMFREAKLKDPSTQLFLNDFNVIKSELRTQMYVKQAQEFLSAGVPVEGLGVQSHLGHRPSGPIILSRLNKLAVAGLPIWVTELDYAHPDDQVRSDILEEVLLAYFSHPSVEGVLFWGFWDKKHFRGADAALVNGDDMVENAAGVMWKRLFHQEWRTKSTKTKLLKRRVVYRRELKAFYGQYNITVRSTDGDILKTKVVTLSKRKGKVLVKITV